MFLRPRPYEPKIQLTILLFLAFLWVAVELDAQTKLINPHLSNSYINSYILPDSTVRFIGSENGRSGGVFYVDKLPDGSITEPVFFPESFGDLQFNFAGVDCKILPLKNGDVLLGINQGDCDYAPYSSLARFNVDGEVVWAVSMENYFFDFFVHKLSMVDTNIICLISDGLDTLYFDIEGNEVAPNPQYVVYDTLITLQNGYFASVGEKLFRLDDQFRVNDFALMDDDILSISTSGDSRVIVSTENSVVVLNTFLEIAVHSVDFPNFNLVTNSTQWIWIGQKNGDIIQLDYQLQPHDTFRMHKDIQLKSMVVINEIITLGGNYISVTGASVFFHSTHADQFSFGIKKDITLESVSLEEPVFYTFEPFAMPWGFNISYKNVVVTLSNTGQDTIEALTILYNAGFGCSICGGEGYRWTFDSLNLYPGQQMDFVLDSFSVWCVTQSPSKFCLSIFPADSLPETDQLNNRLCVDVDAFLTGLHEAESTRLFVSPNPADDFVTIHFEGLNGIGHSGLIFNGRGEMVEAFELKEKSMDISLVDYASGMYFLIILNNQGLSVVEKFIVIH